MASNTESDYITGKKLGRFMNRPVSVNGEKVQRHFNICKELNDLYKRKNHDYGDAFHASYLQWGLPMVAIRLGDKYNRFCNLIRSGTAEVKDESIRDTVADMVNYGIMALMELDREQEVTGENE